MNLKKKCILILLLLSLVLLTVSAVSADGSFDNVQQAIKKANPGETIYLNNTTYTYNGPDGGQGISISKSDIVIYGGNSSNPNLTSTLDGNHKSRIFKVESGVNNITFIGINFINGKSSDGGGAIYFSSDSGNNSWSECIFINNTASFGGAICFWSLSGNNYNNSWSECIFINNTANLGGGGGAIFFVSNSGNNYNNSWSECIFINNTVNCDMYGGGAIFFYSTFGNNYNNSWMDCSFYENTLDDFYLYSGGGAIHFYSNFGNNCNNFWMNCSFNENTADGSGGAIYFYSASGNCNNFWIDCLFNHNTAYDGGAIYFESPSYSFNNLWVNCSFYENTVTQGNGGAIYFNSSSGSDNNITYCIFDNNYAIYGKAIFTYSDMDLNNNFWGTNNITAEEFKNSRLITYTANGYTFKFVPDNFIVLNINPIDNGYTLYFASNGTAEDISSKMPDYLVKIKFNNGNNVITDIGKHSYPADVHDVVNIAAYSLHSNNLLASKIIVPETFSFDIIVGMNNIVHVIVNNGNNATGNVTISVNGTNYTKALNNGSCVFTIENLEPGTYTIIAKWNNYTINKTITLKPLPEYKLTGNDLIKYFKGSECYTVTLTKANKPLSNETVTITINGKSYTRVTDENGTASMAINLNPGNYTVTASWNNSFIINKITVKTTIHAEDFTKYYLNGTQYEAYVLDSQGNPLDGVNVTFNINGVFYTRTAHNGTVKLNINLLPGDYIITAYNDVNGEASSANVTVLPTLTGSDLNMTYKDGSKYECKLVDGQGNPVKGAEVTFNIHGVFYHKITDDEGIARLNINLNPGEYIITAIYGSAMTSNTITVRDL